MILSPTENKQLGEISNKFSLILNAINKLREAVNGSNQRMPPANTETTVTEISGVLIHIDEEIKKIITISNVNICLEPMEENSNSFDADARRIKSR